MSMNEIKEAVVGAVNEQLGTKADASRVEALEAKNAELVASIEEMKNLTADIEAKQNESVVMESKDIEVRFDTKALNEKLRDVFSQKSNPVNLSEIDTKALTIGGAGGEALAIDNELGRTIIERARENVAILGLISNKSVGSVEYREMVLRAYPTTASQSEQTGGTGNGTVWAQTQTQTYVEVVMKVGKQYAKPLISREAVTDPHIDIMAHLETLLAEEVSRYWAVQVLFGTGTGNDIRGILHKDATNGHIDPSKNEEDAGVRDVNFYHVIASGVADSIGDPEATAVNSAIDNAIDLTVVLPSRYLSGARFIMNRRTLGLYRKLKDTQGRPLIQFEAGSFNLVGYSVVIEDYMPDVDGKNAGPNVVKTPVIFGELSKAYALCSIDDDFLYNPYKADGAVMLEYTSRKGDLMQNNDAIVILASQLTFA